MKPSVHELAVVQPFTDVRQVFDDDYRILKGTGVLDGLPRRFLDNICQSVLVVVATMEPVAGPVAPFGVADSMRMRRI